MENNNEFKEEINDFKIKLKKQRLLKNISKKQLGLLIEVTERMISDYELGEDIPDIHTLKKLSKALNVTMDYLWGETNVFEKKHRKPIIHLEDLVSGKSPYTLTLDGKRLTTEELVGALDFIKFRRLQRKKEFISNQ